MTLRIPPWAALPLAALSLLLVETTAYQAFSLTWLSVDLTLPLVLFMGLSDVPISRGAPTAFAIGYFVDLFSASPTGLHSIVLVTVYLFSRTASLKLFSAGLVFQVLLTFLGSLYTSVGIVLLRFIFEQNLENPGSLVATMALRAVSTALVSPWVFGLARRLESWRRDWAV